MERMTTAGGPGPWDPPFTDDPEHEADIVAALAYERDRDFEAEGRAYARRRRVRRLVLVVAGVGFLVGGQAAGYGLMRSAVRAELAAAQAVCASAGAEK